MSERKLNKAALFLAAALLALTVFSISFSAAERFHECHGDDCPICQLLQITEQNIKLLSLALVFAVAVGGARFKKFEDASILCGPVLKSNTLVSQKIRLNV
ncbi:MAG: hypothetical protein IK094_04510 [Treponema sp.]|nr:hypothetical protein [Treponema sp.]